MASSLQHDPAHHILRLLEATLKATGRLTEARQASRDVLEFVAETVAGYVEDGSALDHSDAMALLQDAGLLLHEDDLDELAATVALLTAGPDDVGGDGVDGDDDEDVDDGACELCERVVNRTFHHLVPKETHNRYLGRGSLPANLTHEDGVRGAVCTRAWLNVHGIKVCRTCHSSIHSAERNAVLAEEFNTLARLLEHPKIYAFAKYNSSQPCRGRVHKNRHQPDAKRGGERAGAHNLD